MGTSQCLLLGVPNHIGAAIPELVAGFESCGLHLHPQKCELFHHDADRCEWAEGMRRMTEGTLMLGAAIGWGFCERELCAVGAEV